MTQKAYDCILQQNYTKKTCQQYWYCGVVPIRRYFKQKGIELYSPRVYLRSRLICAKWRK